MDDSIENFLVGIVVGLILVGCAFLIVALINPVVLVENSRLENIDAYLADKSNYTIFDCVEHDNKQDWLICGNNGCEIVGKCLEYCHSRPVPVQECRTVEKFRTLDEPINRTLTVSNGTITTSEIYADFEFYNETICEPKQECVTEEKSNWVEESVGFWARNSAYYSERCYFERDKNCTIENLSEKIWNKYYVPIESSGEKFGMVEKRYNQTTCTPITKTEYYDCISADELNRIRGLIK